MSSPWEVRWSNSKKLPYFFNHETKESIWSPPTGMSEQQMYELPGAKEILIPYQDHQKKTAQAGGNDVQVRASHLLVKHSGSRRPASWKNPNITLSKEEALAQLQEHIDTLNKSSPEELPQAFANLANIHSDCSSHAKGGDLGWFGRKQMQKPFEDATYALEKGQLSGIVDSDSGVHVILRTG